MPVKKNRNLCRQTKIQPETNGTWNGMTWHGIIYQWLIPHYGECFLSRINISVFLSNVPRSVQPLTVTDPHKTLQTLQTLHCSLSLSLSASPGRGCSVPEDVRPISCPAVHTVNRSCCLLSSFHAQSISAHHLLQLPAAEPQWGYEARKPNSSCDDCCAVYQPVQGWRDSLCLFHHWANDTSNRLISCYFSSLIPQAECLQFTTRTKGCKMHRE